MTKECAWNTDLFINGKTVTFKIDTSAEVTAISKETWETLGEPDLRSPNKLLHASLRRFLILGSDVTDLRKSSPYTKGMFYGALWC